MSTSGVPRVVVMTDVVGSTKLTETLGDVEMAARWFQHDRRARSLLLTYNGQEINRTDGFTLVFDDADAALSFSTGYHHILHTLEMSARVGLHAVNRGLAQNGLLRIDPDTKTFTEQVMEMARGGETVFTGQVDDLLQAPRMSGYSCGSWRFKGVIEPVRLFQANSNGSEQVPLADSRVCHRVVQEHGLWVPVERLPRSLPVEPDAFVGRNDDLLALAALVDGGGRLVSILGPGGTGKTRLVTRYAWLWLGAYPGGVWFCDLSDARSVNGIVAAVSRTLDVALGPGDSVEQLGHALAGRARCLVILDNFEQVAEYASETLDRWLDRARDASFVATSRTKLGLSGEVVLSLDSLALDDAVALFVSRATDVNEDFSTDPDQMTLVSELVGMLDRLPSAIELAGSRVAELSVPALLSQIGARLKGDVSRDPAERDAVLRHALDWSWDLLGSEEQSTLAQLSVFEGGFSLESAEAVVSLEDVWAGDVLEDLMDQSWVRIDGNGRMSLMKSVQRYAREQLSADGAAELRHGVWFAQMGSTASVRALSVRGGTERCRALAEEVDNLVAACRRGIARQDAEVAVGALAAVTEVWKLQGPFRSIGTLALDVHNMVDTPADLRIRTLRILAEGHTLVAQRSAANERFAQALAECRAHPNPLAEAHLLALQGRACVRWRMFAWAEEPLRLALDLFRKLQDRDGEALVRGHLGVLLDLRGDGVDAIEHYEVFIAHCREVGDRRGEAIAVSNLGMNYQELGRLASASALLEEGLKIHREVGNRRGESNLLMARAQGHIAVGRGREACDAYELALENHRVLGFRDAEASALVNLANTHVHLNELDRARVCCEGGLAAHVELANAFSQCIALCMLSRIERFAGNLSESRAYAERAILIASGRSDARNQVLGMLRLGQVLSAQGHQGEAIQTLRRAQEIASQRNVRLWDFELLGALVFAGESIDAHELEMAVLRPFPVVNYEERVMLYLAIARVRREAGQFTEAQQALDGASGAAPADAKQLRVQIERMRVAGSSR